MLNQAIADSITGAEARALATTGPHGVNCVPVSVVEVTDEAIYLYDFFMGKTVENVRATPEVALTCWTGLAGVQVKATAEYVTKGELYTQAKTKMLERFPERTLSGVLVLSPTNVYDISAGEEAGQEIVA